MKICYVCSRYADPDIANRRRNLAEARALARWAEAQGYAVVTWWGSIEPTDPPVDSDPEFRRQALARSAALAAMVGKAGGDIVIAGWYNITSGMHADINAYWDAIGMARGGMIPWHEVEPYYTAPVDQWFDTLYRITRRIDERAHDAWGDPGMCTDADVWSDVQKIIMEEIDE